MIPLGSSTIILILFLSEEKFNICSILYFIFFLPTKIIFSSNDVWTSLNPCFAANLTSSKSSGDVATYLTESKELSLLSLSWLSTMHSLSKESAVRNSFI